MIQGSYEGRMGVLVATNKRLVFVDKGIVRVRVEDFPYDKITSIQYETGWVMGTVTIFASGNRAEIKNVMRGRTRTFGDYVRARVSAPAKNASSPAPSAAKPAEEDVIDKLERLAKLKEQGILTEEEFNTQKSKLLDETDLEK